MIYVTQRREKNNVAFFPPERVRPSCIIVGVTFRAANRRLADRPLNTSHPLPLLRAETLRAQQHNPGRASSFRRGRSARGMPLQK